MHGQINIKKDNASNIQMSVLYMWNLRQTTPTPPTLQHQKISLQAKRTD